MLRLFMTVAVLPLATGFHAIQMPVGARQFGGGSALLPRRTPPPSVSARATRAEWALSAAGRRRPGPPKTRRPREMTLSSAVGDPFGGSDGGGDIDDDALGSSMMYDSTSATLSTPAPLGGSDGGDGGEVPVGGVAEGDGSEFIALDQEARTAFVT